MSWLERLTDGFKKTADRLGDNLAGLATKTALDTSTLDDIEEALIASDLGPAASKRIRLAISARRFDQLDERGLRTISPKKLKQSSPRRKARSKCGVSRARTSFW
jgi:fused signal recognition particle receptor